MTRISSALVLSFGFAVVAGAQAQPSVEQILDKYERAIGGRAAFDKFTTRVMIGTFVNETNGLTVPVEIYLKAPNKRVQVLGFGEASEGFNGEVGWSLNTTQNGFLELTGLRLAGAKREAVFNGEIRLRELYAKLTVAGTSKVGDRDADVIEATPSEGAAEKLYFDRQTGLLVRQAVRRMEIDFGDYRVVDDIKLPFSIRRKNPVGVMSTTFRSIKHDVPIDEAKFAVPKD